MPDGQEKAVKYYRRAWYSPTKPLVNEFGKQFPNQKLPVEKRLEVYQRRCKGESLETLSKNYGISTHRVRAIVTHFRKVYGNDGIGAVDAGD